MIWPGFVLLSATALVLRVANQRVFHPADVEWTRSLPVAARQALERVRAGAWADARRRPRWRRRSSSARATCSTSTRRWSATRSRRCSRRSASPTATRCGCSGRRRACTGGAAGRRSSRGARSAATPSSSAAARRRRVRRQPLHLPARPAARARALADHVGLRARGGDHVSAGLGLDPLRDRPGRPRTCYRTFVFGFPVQDFPVDSLVGVRDLPRAGLVVVPGHRRRDARVPAAHDRPRRRRGAAVRRRTSCRCSCCSRSASPA